MDYNDVFHSRPFLVYLPLSLLFPLLQLKS